MAHFLLFAVAAAAAVGNFFVSVESSTLGLKGWAINLKRENICWKLCPAGYSPICASNGEVYPNRCRLEIAQCEDPDVFELDEKYYNCRATYEMSGQCPGIINPTCGSDGILYQNRCIFKLVQNKRPDLDMAPIENCRNLTRREVSEAHAFSPFKKSTHRYMSSCEKPCGHEGPAVCGSDQVMYQNRCILDIASCKRESYGQFGIAPATPAMCSQALGRKLAECKSLCSLLLHSCLDSTGTPAITTFDSDRR
eukprot:GHVU01215584.1.p1 GENE.GHVU01215584.1~~GHVU01215584.1.p1  ORF type:complete len:252 (-),score=9.59 GHVU01215584.1:550-1305(-)